ncbi:bactofilin family protein [Thermorudis peleae]|uniref:bactofilin family protein n=1 Tax=Thermorudis peleae TaxID=1382356 RepID=UPI000690C1A9|nr:polymer-forming cytoskeletal protein [Thermorudis peleae]MBX6753580.1 polymer-forming cytoskeletal protein [Thermorudis peleae]
MIFRREQQSRGEGFQRSVGNFRQTTEQGTAERESEEIERAVLPSEPTLPEARESRVAPSWTMPMETEPRIRTSQSAQPAPAPSVDANTTLLAANAQWEGVLRSDGAVAIHGQLQGEVHSAGDVTIAEGARVEAQIFAHNVLIHGQVRGKVEARNRLEIFPQGEVIGDVKAPSLVVHEGAKLSGQLRMDDEGRKG